MMLTAVVSNLGLFSLWSRDLSISLGNAAAVVEHVIATSHGVVCLSVWFICWMHASLLCTDWSPMDGLSADHCCDPDSLEVKADLSACFPELWASHPIAVLLGSRWVIAVWSQRCYLARDWVVTLSSVCADLSFAELQKAYLHLAQVGSLKKKWDWLKFKTACYYGKMESYFKLVRIISLLWIFSYCSSIDSLRRAVIYTFKSLSMHSSNCEATYQCNARVAVLAEVAGPLHARTPFSSE